MKETLNHITLYSILLLSPGIFSSCNSETDVQDPDESTAITKHDTERSVKAPVEELTFVNKECRKYGIGLLTGGFHFINLRARQPDIVADTMLQFLDQTLNNNIGQVELVGNSMLLYDAYTVSDGDTGRYFSCDTDRPSGMSSIENAIHVHGLKDGHINILNCRYRPDGVWMELGSLGSRFQFISWKEYFLRFPNGNESWEHGYEWIGVSGATVRTGPSLINQVVDTLGGGKEIYLTGQTTDGYFEVIVKEVTYEFGEMYFEKAEYGEQYRGWVKLVSEEGYPLIREVILGC